MRQADMAGISNVILLWGCHDAVYLPAQRVQVPIFQILRHHIGKHVKAKECQTEVLGPSGQAKLINTQP